MSAGFDREEDDTGVEVMPAHGPLIGEDAVKVVSGYVLSLSREQNMAQQGGAQ